MSLVAREAGLEAFYDIHCGYVARAITAHLPRLRELATGLRLAVEFGVRHGASSSALLMGADKVIGVDITATRSGRSLKELVGSRWDYRIEDSRTTIIPWCDLLFVDSQHDYQQVDAELKQHAAKVGRYLVFHDVTTFGEVAADGESGRQRWQYQPGSSCPPEHLGIRPAIDELMMRDPSWQIKARYTDSHGLLVLERR